MQPLPPLRRRPSLGDGPRARALFGLVGCGAIVAFAPGLTLVVHALRVLLG